MTTTIMQLMENFVGFLLSLKAIMVASVEIWFCVCSIRVLSGYCQGIVKTFESSLL